MKGEGCINSQTLLRRILIRLSPKRPPRWLKARTVWRFYGFLDWLSWRMQDLAMVLEDEELRREKWLDYLASVSSSSR